VRKSGTHLSTSSSIVTRASVPQLNDIPKKTLTFRKVRRNRVHLPYA